MKLQCREKEDRKKVESSDIIYLLSFIPKVCTNLIGLPLITVFRSVPRHSTCLMAITQDISFIKPLTLFLHQTIISYLLHVQHHLHRVHHIHLQQLGSAYFLPLHIFLLLVTHLEHHMLQDRHWKAQHCIMPLKHPSWCDSFVAPATTFLCVLPLLVSACQEQMSCEW